MEEQEKITANREENETAENRDKAERRQYSGDVAATEDAAFRAEEPANVAENNRKKEKAAAEKKRGWRNRVGNLLLVGGIVVICIPFVGRYLADRQQQQMLKDFYNQADINAEVGAEAEKLNHELGYTDDTSLQGDLDASAKAIREIEQSEGLDPKTVTKLSTGPTAIGIIEIPKIKLKYPVAEGVDNVTLRFCIGHMPKTAELGETGNSVLAGHRSHSFGDFFNRLDELKSGDSIWIKTKSDSTLYVVYEKKRVDKSDLSVLAQKNSGKELTLITCELGVNPTERIIIKAKAE